MWIGERRGYFMDWATQRWVQATGRVVDLGKEPWLDAPTGTPRGISTQFVDDVVTSERLSIDETTQAGLLADFTALAAPDFDVSAADARVVDFYLRTSDFELDSWAEWNGIFRPFGRALALLFSRRLQQLNVPLSGLDTSHGVTSQVVRLVDPATRAPRMTIWLRTLVRSGDVLYAGCYSVATVPGRAGACVRVAFPLPHGNAVVIMRPELRPDGSVVLVSSGKRFGDPGFYFTVEAGADRVWVRYVRSLRETIHVYSAERGTVRADHELTLWGQPVLRLHYRLRDTSSESTS
jgi:hypothetical protein